MYFECDRVKHPTPPPPTPLPPANRILQTIAVEFRLKLIRKGT